jgi:hypothetical protein
MGDAGKLHRWQRVVSKPVPVSIAMRAIVRGKPNKLALHLQASALILSIVGTGTSLHHRQVVGSIQQTREFRYQSFSIIEGAASDHPYIDMSTGGAETPCNI